MFVQVLSTCGGVVERSVDARPTDAQLLRNHCRRHPFIAQFPHRSYVDSRFAALVDASRLGLLDTFALAFLANVGLELRDGCEHAKKQLAGAGGRIDPRLLQAT